LAGGPGELPRTAEAASAAYRAYLEGARRLAEELQARFAKAELATTERDLIPFLYAKTSLAETRR
jgi:hypothetical protein